MESVEEYKERIDKKCLESIEKSKVVEKELEEIAKYLREYNSEKTEIIDTTNCDN